MSKPSDSKASIRDDQAAPGASLDRRRFFLMGGSAVAAAAAAVVPMTDAKAEEPQAERVKPRYKETDHVKNFYRVNRY